MLLKAQSEKIKAGLSWRDAKEVLRGDPVYEALGRDVRYTTSHDIRPFITTIHSPCITFHSFPRQSPFISTTGHCKHKIQVERRFLALTLSVSSLCVNVRERNYEKHMKSVDANAKTAFETALQLQITEGAIPRGFAKFRDTERYTIMSTVTLSYTYHHVNR